MNKCAYLAVVAGDECPSRAPINGSEAPSDASLTREVVPEIMNAEASDTCGLANRTPSLGNLNNVTLLAVARKDKFAKWFLLPGDVC